MGYSCWNPSEIPGRSRRIGCVTGTHRPWSRPPRARRGELLMRSQRSARYRRLLLVTNQCAEIYNAIIAVCDAASLLRQGHLICSIARNRSLIHHTCTGYTLRYTAMHFSYNISIAAYFVPGLYNLNYWY